MPGDVQNVILSSIKPSEAGEGILQQIRDLTESSTIDNIKLPDITDRSERLDLLRWLSAQSDLGQIKRKNSMTFSSL